ncbi:hypothetical protein QTP88_025874 [Uroleucon formosanum]
MSTIRFQQHRDIITSHGIELSLSSFIKYYNIMSCMRRLYVSELFILSAKQIDIQLIKSTPKAHRYQMCKEKNWISVHDTESKSAKDSTARDSRLLDSWKRHGREDDDC